MHSEDTARLVAQLPPDKQALFFARLRAERAKEQRAAIPVQTEAAPPLSFAQQRLWFLERLYPSSQAYTIPVVIDLKGPLDDTLLEAALAAIVTRHAILRTRLCVVAGEPRQVVQPDAGDFRLERQRLPSTPDTRASDLEEATASIVNRPLALEGGPLYRATLLQWGADEYRFILCLHHAIADGWSVHVLLDELSTLYHDLHAGHAPRLAPLPIQYADFAVWQREQHATLTTDLDYWVRALADAPRVLELPIAAPRPAVQRFRGARYPISIAPSLLGALRRLSQQHATTLYTTLLSALAGLLHRYTGQTDLVIGSPIANRTHVDLEPLIGFFTNTLALRARVSPIDSFEALLAQMRRTTQAAFAHQEAPFEQIVQRLVSERTLAHNPLVQVMFALQSVPPLTLRLPDVATTLVDYHNGTAKFDLTIELWEREDGLTGWCEYDTDLFTSAAVEQLMRHWEVLLTEVADAPGRKLCEVPLATAAEQQRRRAWNATAVAYREDFVHERFARHAVERPEAPALIAPTQHWSYRELNARSDEIAHCLSAVGVGHEDVIAVLLDHAPDFVASFLGILKTGAAYLPIDPTTPKARVAFMLADAGARVVLTQTAFRDTLPALPALQALYLDEHEAGTRGLGPYPTRRVYPEQLAYVIYTSGSTGTPKGVAIAHRGLTNLVHWHQRQYAVTASDRASVVASAAFDAMVWELWPYLSAGACVLFPDAVTRVTPARLVSWLAEQSVTMAFLPTPLAEATFDEAWPPTTRLRFLLTGGDRLQRFPPAALPFTVVNHYGPTESTVLSTSAPVAPSSRHDGTAPPIGYPIANSQIYLLNDCMQPVPDGVEGELYIGGVGVARGYLHQPMLTAERFVPSPFGVGERLYRTGDLARYAPDGAIEFIGRRDLQVKMRGFRIELGEIEATLLHHPAVQQAVVIVSSEQSSPQLLAYVIEKSGETATPDALLSHCRAHLPAYMVPHRVMRLTAFPLTTNGKIDRRALPQPPRVEDERPQSLELATPLQRQLVEMWQELLGLPSVGIHDNFFMLGGHSLLAAQVIGRIEQTLGLSLSLRAFFEAPTIAGLATVLAATRQQPVSSSGMRVVKGAQSQEEILLAAIDTLSEADVAAFLQAYQPDHLRDNR